MRSTETVIQPVYEDGIDLTHTWGDRLHGDIFPAVYRRYRAPKSVSECEQMISDLATVVSSIADQYESARGEAIGLGLDPVRDRATKDKLKVIRTARNRYEAIRRAYIHWLAVEQGEPVGLSVIGATQLSTRGRIDLLGQAMLQLVDLYIADLDESKSTAEIKELLHSLKQRLDTASASSSQQSIRATPD